MKDFQAFKKDRRMILIILSSIQRVLKSLVYQREKAVLVKSLPDFLPLHLYGIF